MPAKRRAVASGLAVANAYYAQPMLDAIADELGLARAAAGSIVTGTQLGYGLGLVLLAPLGDRLDRRRLIAGQLFLAAVALAAAGLAPTAAALLAALAAVGALAVVAQVMVAYASVLAPAPERGRAVALVTGGIVAGILLARVVAGAVSDLLGWRAVYLAAAAATLLVAALLFGRLPRAAPPAVKLPYRRLIGSVFVLFREERELRVRATLALLVFAAITLLLTPLVLPLAAPPWSLSHTEIGLFGLAGVAGALGASRAGRAADAGGAQRTIGVGLALMLAAWLPVSLLPYSLWLLAAGVLIMDFGLQSVHVASQSLLYRVRPEAQSRLAAGYMLLYAIGCAAGALASTLVYAAAGWVGVCVAGRRRERRGARLLGLHPAFGAHDRRRLGGPPGGWPASSASTSVAGLRRRGRYVGRCLRDRTAQRVLAHDLRVGEDVVRARRVVRKRSEISETAGGIEIPGAFEPLGYRDEIRRCLFLQQRGYRREDQTMLEVEEIIDGDAINDGIPSQVIE